VPDDDSMLGQNLVDVRNEERRYAQRALPEADRARLVLAHKRPLGLLLPGAERKSMRPRERRVWFLLALLGALVVGLILAERVSAHNRPNTEHNRRHAITHAFCGSLRPCSLGREALRVAYCESGPSLWPYARNGQYTGMFQFGAWARSAYGFSWSPWEQARAAKRYYNSSGWSGWSCKP
jgi:hypothetical protein